MRAVQVSELDGPSAVRVAEVEAPGRGDGEVLIDVAAAGVNFPDVLLTKGMYQYKPEPPFTLGSECAGTVREAGPESRFSAGDRVVAFTMSGVFAETVSVPEQFVFPLPDEVGFPAGACLPMNYLTAHFTLETRGGLRAGETVLVQGAAGGIGTAVIQLAAAMGATVIGVTSTEAKAEVARRAGAAHTVGVDGFKDAVTELTGGAGVDMVVDPVGGDRFTDSLRCLGPLGRLMVIGFTAGDIPTVKVNRLLLNNIDVRGVGWGAYALGRPDFIRSEWDALVPHLRSGALDPLISESFGLDDAATALSRIDDRTVTGKVVLLTGPESG
ncbi:NADPH:quinone oxidoreductase family protein [Pseudonocardia sp. ICBG1293]|uniref:NADPH:quinone oxidoreductase family protein n=1 Tax=Pseudonocardia sp. ICBG1293 TaxID=2844382 RepID=UPI001CCCF007|nr:NADPH:quinone oxidoreductase family protein [Pseudonocardia sp. ICBG1293]